MAREEAEVEDTTQTIPAEQVAQVARLVEAKVDREQILALQALAEQELPILEAAVEELA